MSQLAEKLAEGMTIAQRIVCILDELPAIGKDQRNEQQKFMYRGHDDVMAALNPLLAKHGVFVAPRVLKRVPGERTTVRGNTMYEVNLHVAYRFYGAGGDYIEASAWGEGTDSGDKSTNKAMTMAFKNVLAQVFAISTHELSDADAVSPEETTRSSGERGDRSGDSQHREFDPGRDQLPTAMTVTSARDVEHLRAAQSVLSHPDEDWLLIEEGLAHHVYGHGLDDLTQRENPEYWRRLANAVVRAWDLAGGGDFPPPSPDQVREAYAWAFKGASVALTAPVTPSEGDPGAAGTSAQEQAAQQDLADA